MGNEQQHVETTRVKKGARPWIGFVFGLLFGVALAVLLQQAGVWPLDRLLLFGSAGLFALIGILLGSAGRQRVGAASAIIPLVLAVALIAFGATGLTAVNEHGELNGGCTVSATSNLDTTVVTDTSRQDPFKIDPEGSLSWVATSPAPIMNHLWEIYVDIGGFPLVIASNDEPEPNTAGNLENSGDVPDVSVYVEEVSDYADFALIGVLEVGGNIDGDGGACDGFGFVRLVDDALSSLIAQIAAGVALLSLIGLLALVFAPKTREAEMVPEPSDGQGAYAAVGEPAVEAEPPPSPDSTAGGMAGGGMAGGGGAHERRDEPPEAGSGEEPASGDGG
jgi:hypothetical protein